MSIEWKKFLMYFLCSFSPSEREREREGMSRIMEKYHQWPSPTKRWYRRTTGCENGKRKHRKKRKWKWITIMVILEVPSTRLEIINSKLITDNYILLSRQNENKSSEEKERHATYCNAWWDPRGAVNRPSRENAKKWTVCALRAT